jgi:hypothetical protein
MLLYAIYLSKQQNHQELRIQIVRPDKNMSSGLVVLLNLYLFK